MYCVALELMGHVHGEDVIEAFWYILRSELFLHFRGEKRKQ